MFNLFKKEMVTLQKYRPVFTTVDGNNHIGLEYKYGIANRFRRGIPEYIMIDINSDGYIEDHRNVMYPLANVLSIDWQLMDEKEIEDRFDMYTLFLSDETVEKYS